MIFFVFLFTHCRQEIADEVKPSKEKDVKLKLAPQDVFLRITVENGRVKFANDQDFNLYFQEAQNRGIEYAEGFFANLPNFYSLKEKNQAAELALANESEDLSCRTLNTREGNEVVCQNVNPPTADEEGPEGETTLVEDDFVYFFLNHNAEFMISDKVVRITPRYTYIYASDTTVVFDDRVENLTEQSLYQLKSAADDEFFKVKDNLWAFKIQTLKQTFEEDKTGYTNKFLGFSCGDYSLKRELEYRTARPKRKLKGKLFSQNLGVVASAGMLTKNLKRRLGLWWQEKAETIRLDWFNINWEEKNPADGQYYPFSMPNESKIGFGKSQLEKPISFNTAIIGCTLDINTGECKKIKIKFSTCIKLKKGCKTFHYAKKAGKDGSFNLEIL